MVLTQYNAISAILARGPESIGSLINWTVSATVSQQIEIAAAYLRMKSTGLSDCDQQKSQIFDKILNSLESRKLEKMLAKHLHFEKTKSLSRAASQRVQQTVPNRGGSMVCLIPIAPNPSVSDTAPSPIATTAGFEKIVLSRGALRRKRVRCRRFNAEILYLLWV